MTDSESQENRSNNTAPSGRGNGSDRQLRLNFDSSPIRDNPAARENLTLNLPNLISALRIGSAPVLVWLALSGMHEEYLWVLLFALATDGIDGYLARKWHQVTRLGAQLDSWADLIIYTVMLFGLWQLWPQWFDAESGYLIIAFSFWLMSVLLAVVRFGRLPSYHTWGSKIAAVGLAPAYFLLVLLEIQWPFRAVMLFFVYVAVEQLVITAILHRWQRDVKSFWHALRIVRDETRQSRSDTGDQG
ncbi:MAG: CDP-alcohol phosphatidyltransferase family protein [bacterium]